MNRRNFVVGLGTVATVSGVASVTAASFADQVEAGANFQVIVDEDLTVELGEEVPDEEQLDDTPSWTSDPITGDGFDNVDFDDDDEGLLAYVDYDAGEGEEDPVNDELDFELAVLNDDETGDGYEQFLNIQNDGAIEQTVGIQYVYGEDVDTEGFDNDLQNNTNTGDIDATTVNELFVFETNGDIDQLSPEATDGEEEEPGEVVVDVGENQIDLNINLDGVIEDLAAAADGDGIFDDGGVEDQLDLLDSIVVGIIDDE